MAHPDYSPRVGRSQGVLIFWGLVSVVFAALFCFYYWKNHENEANANKLRDEVLTLEDQRDALTAEKEKLQAGMNDAETQLKTREDLVQEKESKLADEEANLDASAAKQTQNPPAQGASQPNPSPAAMNKKFDELMHKLDGNQGTEVITHGGRPILRVPNPVFFAPGDATLKPEGKALLNQIAQSLNGQLDNFELRFESFTDSDAEMEKDAAAKAHFANSWELTAARAAAIARYYRDQTSLPFQNVLAIARGDSEPIVTGAKDDLTRNCRIEVTLTPLPAAFRSSEPAHSASSASANAPVNPLAPPPDPPHPANKAP